MIQFFGVFSFCFYCLFVSVCRRECWALLFFFFSKVERSYFAVFLRNYGFCFLPFFFFKSMLLLAGVTFFFLLASLSLAITIKNTFLFFSFSLLPNTRASRFLCVPLFFFLDLAHLTGTFERACASKKLAV